jgi:glycosyltransferase involved in cell wall biosynthesis
MTAYNGANYIREQLDSIAAQSRLPDELIVCDDHSVDCTPEIVEDFASKARFPVRLIVNDENLGYVKNTEKAISLSTGSIIFLSDQDDIWHPEKLRRAEAIFSNSPRVGAVFSNAEIVDEHLNPLGYSLWHSANFTKSRQKRFARGKTFKVLCEGNVVYGCTMSFRATFKDLVLPISRIWDDDEWIALLVSTAAELAVVHEPLVKYRQHSNNAFGAQKKASLSERLNRAQQPGGTTIYSGLADQYASLHRRLLEATGYPRDLRAISMLEDRIKHLRERAEIEERGILNRLPSVLQELATLRYHRYSGGWKSAAKDLLF